MNCQILENQYWANNSSFSCMIAISNDLDLDLYYTVRNEIFFTV